jgi:hypothetical protein
MRPSKTTPRLSRLDSLHHLPVGWDLDDPPSLKEVIAGGLGDELRPVGNSRVVRVTVESHREFAFLLNQREYLQWLENRTAQPQTPRPHRSDAFGRVRGRARSLEGSA